MFSNQDGTSATAPGVEDVVDFLSDLFDQSYSAVNTARSDHY